MTLSDEFRELNRRFVAVIMERNIEDKKFIKAATIRTLIFDKI